MSPRVACLRRIRWQGTVLVLVSTLCGCAASGSNTCPAVGLEASKPPIRRDPMVPVLQRRIHERERRIAELQIQLDTLKHIELDVRTEKKNSSSQ